MTDRRVTRSCIGCRSHADKSGLLRVVAVVDTSQPVPGAKEVVPDERGRLAGRGAYLHRDLACFELAKRRRAFGRALRLVGQPGLTAVQQWFDEQVFADRTSGPRTTGHDEGDTT